MAYLRDSHTATAGLSIWDTAGIKVEWNTDPKIGVKDFEESLQRNGAIVVYIGHSTLTATPKGQPEGPSLGLSPENPKKGLKSQTPDSEVY